jgi:TolA-binding protein
MKQVVRLLMVVVLVFACSRKKDTFTSRTYHNMVSTYNTLFNGQQALEKSILAIEKGYVEDYSAILPVKVYGTEALSNQAGPDLDLTIEKAVKVITDHSMMIANKQRNKYIDDAYLMMGKAYFYKRDYFKAIETFKYTSGNFPRTEAYWEALYWSAVAQNEQGNHYSAELELEELYKNARAPKEFKVEVPLVMAQVYIYEKNFTQAIGSLREALKAGMEKSRKARMYFILGQLHERLGQRYDAQEAFKEVIALKPNYNMLFQAQLNYAKNSDIDLTNLPEVYALLEQMLRNSNNKEFLDQIYFVMSTVAMIEEDFVKAEDFLKASLRANTANKLQEGMSHRRLGDINLTFKSYPLAAAHYDSANQVWPKGHPEFLEVGKKTAALRDLVDNLQVVATNDSLLALSLMSPQEQLQAVDAYIAGLIAAEEAQKKREEAAQREKEAMAAAEQGAVDRPSMGGPGGLGGPPMPGGPSAGGAWYLYNPAAMSRGFTDFNAKWGNRKLEDQWRRSSRTAQEVVQANATGGGAVKQGEAEVAATSGVEGGDPRFQPATWLAKIPATEADRQVLRDAILEALYQAGTLFRERFALFKEAELRYQELLKRYPGHSTTPRTYFALYRLYKQIPDESKALAMRSKLLSEYPESVYAQSLEETAPKTTLTAALTAYRGAYEAYKAKSYDTAYAMCVDGLAQYPDDALAPKFALLSAMCLGYQRNDAAFRERLEWVIDQYPADPVAIEARNYLDHLGKGGGNQGLEELKEPHRFVAVFPAKGANAQDIRRKVGNYTNEKYPGANLQVQNLILDDDRQMVLVGEFETSLKAKAFYNNILKEPGLVQSFPKGSTQFFYIANSRLKTLMADKKVEEFLQKFNAQNP